MSLPYGGDAGNALIKKLKRTLQKTLPDNVQPTISVRGTKLQSQFQIKDKVREKHSTDFIYGYDCKQSDTCKENYVGETRRRKEKRTNEHAHTDKNLQTLNRKQA